MIRLVSDNVSFGSVSTGVEASMPTAHSAYLQQAVYDLTTSRTPHVAARHSFLTDREYQQYCAGYETALVWALRVLEAADTTLAERDAADLTARQTRVAAYLDAVVRAEKIRLVP